MNVVFAILQNGSQIIKTSILGGANLQLTLIKSFFKALKAKLNVAKRD